MRLAILALFVSFSSFAQIVLTSKVDDRFGGYYIDVEATRMNLSHDLKRDVSMYETLTAQKYLRDCLQSKSNSFFRMDQGPFLKYCLAFSEGQIKGLRQKAEVLGFKVVFDMDETLLTQWHRIARDNPEKTTFIVKNRDFSMSESKREIIMAPKGVTIRPGMVELLESLSKDPKIGGIYFFSAREDASAYELKDYFMNHVPSLKNKFKGLMARNHLRFDGDINTPSKDLHIISKNLKKLILVDDNPSRVLQKNLNFTIPKFNADLYLDAVEKHDEVVINANYDAVHFVERLIEQTANGAEFYPYSTEYAELNKIDWGKRILELCGLSHEVIETLLKEKIFDQEFIAAETIKL